MMDFVVPTKSLQGIFTPILSQITELMIVTSENYGPEASGDSVNILRPLVSMSEDIVESLKDLTTVCQQTITLEYSDDTVARREVDFGSQNLLVTGESLVLCCHILCSASQPNFQLKTPVPHQNDIPGCLSDLNQCMLLLLLSVDDAEVRKIVNYGWATTEGLASLAAADTLQNLNAQFRVFAAPAANFHLSASSRCNDLLDNKLHYKLKCSLTTLRQSLPMLTAALQMAIKYPDNDEVLKGRDFCVEQVRKAIAEIVKIVTTKNARKSFLPGTNIGLFNEKLNQIKSIVSPDNRKNLKMVDLHSNIECFVQHAMELSLILVKKSPPLQIKSNAVVSSCRKIMRSMRELEKAGEAVGDETSPNKKSQELYDEKCTLVNATSQGAMAAILHADTVLVTHTFKCMDEPLATLVDACVSPEKGTQDSSEKMHEYNESESNRMKELSKIFLNHTSDIMTSARFSASCCQHAAIYQKFSKVIMNFDQLSRAITIAASEYFTKETRNDFEENNNLIENDRILDLQEKWIVVLGDLIQLVVASLNLKELLDIIVEETTRSLEKCTEGIVNMSEAEVATHLQNAMGKARLLARVANAVVSCSTDPVYRNGVLSHVKALKNYIANCVARGNQLIEDIGRVEEQELFSRVADNLLDCVKSVSEAILSDGNHPDLTSANRMNVRDNDTGSTDAVLREMRALNEKLILLGFDPITDEELETPYPVPTSNEPGWPRYFYNEDQQAQHMDRGESITSVSTAETYQREDSTDDTLQDLESLPGKIHPVIDNLLSCLRNAQRRNSSRNVELEKAKELIGEVCEICTDIAQDCLLQSQISRPKDENSQAVQKASMRIGTLGDLILKEVADLMSSSKSEEPDKASLHLLGLQWSKALYIISVGCARILPLHMVPVRRYLALSLDKDVEDVHSLARCIISYPGSLSNFVTKLTEFRENSLSKEDKSSVGDFNVHEQNVRELIQLVDAISSLTDVDEEKEEREDNSQADEISALCEIVDFDWSTACQTKEEIMRIVDKLSSGAENSVDKSILQLHCLAWSAKIHCIHCSIHRATTLILESFDVKIQDSGLYELTLDANMSKVAEIDDYKQQLIEYMNEQRNAMAGSPRSNDLLMSTWDENLRVTSNVMKEILDYLCNVRSSVPLVFHHGHSMFHFIYLHHLFFLILSYLKLSMQQEIVQEVVTERSDVGKRPSLSARLQSLKEERERRDESLNDLLTSVPKIIL